MSRHMRGGRATAAQRRDSAQARQILHDALTTVEKLRKLVDTATARNDYGGSKRERHRLEKELLSGFEKR